MNYIEISFANLTKETIEILIALLSDLQVEGFEETDDSLKAYIAKDMLNEDEIKPIADQLNVQYQLTEIPAANWNAVWESNFQPIEIGDWAIRADFHQPLKDAAHEIIITPKMSFGTGHHATTYMMVEQMQHINFTNTTVLDFGTGTGVLAILAKKLGAIHVYAFDNDEFSIDNAEENFKKNNADTISLQLADHISVGTNYDIILANITRNVILEHFQALNDHLKSNGILLLSGLLVDDESSILSVAKEHQLILHKKQERENWICLWFEKSYPVI